MAALLDLLAVAAVIAALAYLLRRRGKGSCSNCGPAPKGAETKVSLSQLRATARRPGTQR